MRTRLVVLLLALSTAGFGGDWAFDHIVKAIESHYGTTRIRIPFTGVANFFVKVRRPAGTSGFKLAVFENLDSSPAYQDQEELDRFMKSISNNGLHPLVRVHSRRNDESTYIYMGEAGRSTSLLITTFERNEATVVQVKVSTVGLLEALQDPERTARSFRDN
jgi:hypothetical protein